MSRLFPGLAVIAILAAALTLTACGRKGPLDPPPAASVTGEKTAVTGDPSAPKPAPGAVDKSAALGPDGRPIAAPNKRFFLDGLLN